MLFPLPMEKIALVHRTTKKGTSFTRITAADESERRRQIENQSLTPSSWRWGPIITIPPEVKLLSAESFPAFYSYTTHRSESIKCALWGFYHISLNEPLKSGLNRKRNEKRIFYFSWYSVRSVSNVLVTWNFSISSV